MSLANNITEINASAKKIHGEDICIMVARSVAMGHEDNLVVVMGKNHRAAAFDFGRVIPGARISEEKRSGADFGDGKVTPDYTVSHVAF